MIPIVLISGRGTEYPSGFPVTIHSLSDESSTSSILEVLNLIAKSELSVLEPTVRILEMLTSYGDLFELDLRMLVGYDGGEYSATTNQIMSDFPVITAESLNTILPKNPEMNRAQGADDELSFEATSLTDDEEESSDGSART